MKLFKFEGTAEELQVAYSLLADDAAAKNLGNETSIPPKPIPSAEPEKTGELTEEVAVAFLTRRPLPKNQVAIIKTLSGVEDGQGLKSSELAATIGCTVAEIQGSMRAFGKRAAHTQGWPSGVRAFQRKWLGSEMSYRLHPVVHAVFDKETRHT